MSEIDPCVILCNGCWLPLHDKAYKTSCSHVFCRACAESFFSKRQICPLCDAAVGGEAGIIELATDKSPAACLRAFALAVFHPEDAQRLASDALTWARSQTALYGTRECWLKSQEVEGLKRRLTEADNRLHTLMSELQ